MWYKKILSIFFGLLIAFTLCEIVLRIYNPYRSRVRGNEIVLKSNYKKKIVIYPEVVGLEAEVKYSTNSLGFRGPEPIKNWNEATTILTVGGSTTECSLLSDDSTWTARLYNKLSKNKANLWMNNAGMDGCSSYGHLILMRDYIVKLKPDYVVFLVGVNDLVKSSFQNEDGFLISREESWWRKLLKKSELITTISNVSAAFKSHKANITHGQNPYNYKDNDLNKLDSVKRIEMETRLGPMIKDYIIRIDKLSKISIENGIKPIFVTQPKFDDNSAYSWQVMQKYNTALMQYCSSNSITVINLADSLPKKVEYYYDQVHYTNAGAQKIADLLYPDILNIINQ